MATSLVNFRDGAKELADKVGDGSILDTTWNIWVNQGIEALWQAVSTAFGDNFYKTKDFTLTGGAGSGSQYDLAANVADFRRVRFVEKDPDTTMRRKIRRFNFNEKDGQQGYWGAYNQYRRYRQMGTLLFIEPLEIAGGNYRLYYVPAPTKLVADSDTIDGTLEQWAEFPMCFAAVKGLGKEESDTSFPGARLAELRADIEASAAQQDVGEGDVIGDITSFDRWTPWA